MEGSHVEIGADLAKKFVKQARVAFLNFQTPSSNYNAWKKVGGYGRDIVTFTESSDIVMLIRNDIRAELDVEVLTESLKNSGFGNVQILSGKLKNILITMEDKSQKSVLFYSKLLKMQNGSLSVDFSYENLRNFYENADEQLQSDLDLLLAPVFNDEKMTESEYLETIATFYGEKMASELAESFISLIVVNIDGKQQVQKISIPKILCGM